MFFLDMLEIDRVVRQLKSMYGSIDESLRGWNWSNEILSPPINGIYLGVSELTNRYCSTYRDIYLKRVLSKPAPYSYKTIRGWIYHRVCKKVVEKAKSILYLEGIVNGPKLYSSLLIDRSDEISRILEEYKVSSYLRENEVQKLKREAEVLYGFLALQAAARLDRVLSHLARPELESIISKVIPVDVERIVNGQLLGLSSELRIDMFADKRIVIEIKTGEIRDFHKYTITGYALAVESDLDIPIDYGIVSYILISRENVKIRNKIYFIGDELRREFLEIRDEAFNIIQRGIDPGKPPECPEYCIYYGACS
ncbi:MAG: type I-A CRISPR-associated protein Cas4/Csa1 [Aigarchaeota archaeon]|nr:type I-A CRISPR-associated protein Cas4/Csa1 [Aigarchaeota archaeon]MCX8193726.1 type I-A CRISPR-associated protein Cas4/Csa1 [Nitrososphaeria archaeon]